MCNDPEKSLESPSESVWTVEVTDIAVAVLESVTDSVIAH